jgi:hypothetical protein
MFWFTTPCSYRASPGDLSKTPGFAQWRNMRAGAKVHGIRQRAEAFVCHLAFTPVLSLKVATATVR